MRINKEEHLKQAWRVHSLLPDLRIEDVWSLPVEMEKDQPIGELYTVFVEALERTATKGVAGWLFKLRFFLGRIFGWEDEEKAQASLPAGSIRERYAKAEGFSYHEVDWKSYGDFVPVYDLGEEMLAEIENETVLAAAHFAKVPKANGKYEAQMTVYVKPKGLLGACYMQLIKPFRLYIVYPAMLKLVGRCWDSHRRRHLELSD